ncbi:FG-GAP repeat domain-containing protein [Streptomyces pilosus]|uniref:FG-GAP repeat domain-containing protein n=1 Tax=Streptomyces pilosus TaxID=28893 RepID=UPI0036FBB220
MGKIWRRGSVAVAVGALLTFGVGTGGTPAAAAVACPSGVESDFNGDGIRDTAIADPEATVTGVRGAGEIHVVYGGGKGTLTVSQALDSIPGGPETGDRYGFALAVYDADLDGCSDLVVGTPYEDLGTVPDAGVVQLLHGSPAGLNGGKAVKEFLQGADKPLSGGPEAEDWVGYAVAAGKTSSGTPYLLIGCPGESIGDIQDAGGFHYVSGTAQTVTLNHQDTDKAGAVAGVAEADDRFGSSLAATPTHFAVGNPGEAIGTTPFGGGAGYFSHALTSGYPKPLGGLSQDLDGISGAEEAGDQFGASLAMVPYRSSGATTTTQVLLAVGVPGEDLSTTVDAGAVQVFRIAANGTYDEVAWIDQNTADVAEDTEAGDFFGQQLAAVNTAPNATSTGANTRLAVGVPGEESSDEHRDKGGVHIIPLVGPPGASDEWIDPGYGIPGAPAHRQLAGLSLAATPSLLHVGMPYGPAESRAVHGFPWNVASGGEPTVTFRPGEGGIPATGTAFGAAVR